MGAPAAAWEGRSTCAPRIGNYHDCRHYDGWGVLVRKILHCRLLSEVRFVPALRGSTLQSHGPAFN